MIDFRTIVSSAMLAFLLFFVVTAVVAALKLPQVKGWFGEKIVETVGKTVLDSEEYIQFHDVILRDTDGSTTQIDHVSPYGIFVIETKTITDGYSVPNMTRNGFKNSTGIRIGSRIL